MSDSEHTFKLKADSGASKRACTVRKNGYLVTDHPRKVKAEEVEFAAWKTASIEDVIECVWKSFRWTDLIHVHNHSPDVVMEYVRFIALKLCMEDVITIPPKLAPSYLVDQVWHTHMLCPQLYLQMCTFLLGPGRVFHHTPTARVDEERYALTLCVYQQHLHKIPPPAIWPDESEEDDQKPSFQVKVKGMTGRVCRVQCQLTDTVQDLALKLVACFGIPVDDQRLICHGRQLRVDESLTDAGISPSSMVHLVPRLRGC